MMYVRRCGLHDFPAWGGAMHTLYAIIKADKVKEAEEFIQTHARADRVPTETDINDMLWYCRDEISSHIGVNLDEYL